MLNLVFTRRPETRVEVLWLFLAFLQCIVIGLLGYLCGSWGGRCLCLQALREGVVGPEVGEDAKFQHAAFALLQRLGQRPPTLHRTLPDRPIPPEGSTPPDA